MLLILPFLPLAASQGFNPLLTLYDFHAGIMSVGRIKVLLCTVIVLLNSCTVPVNFNLVICSKCNLYVYVHLHIQCAIQACIGKINTVVECRIKCTCTLPTENAETAKLSNLCGNMEHHGMHIGSDILLLVALVSSQCQEVIDPLFSL